MKNLKKITLSLMTISMLAACMNSERYTKNDESQKVQSTTTKDQVVEQEIKEEIKFVFDMEIK